MQFYVGCDAALLNTYFHAYLGHVSASAVRPEIPKWIRFKNIPILC